MNVEGLKRSIAETRGDRYMVLVGFKMAHFVEFFFEDAEVISAELGIVLANRGRDLNVSIPMCGVPAGAPFQRATARLAAAGYSVVVVRDHDQGSCSDKHADSELEPIAIDDLSPSQRQELVALLFDAQELERRTASLHDRLSAYGLARQADTLGVRRLTLQSDADTLDAIETIVTTIERRARAMC